MNIGTSALTRGILLLSLLASPRALLGAEQTTDWPNTVEGPDASVTVYQPQVMSWADHKTLKTRTAIAVQPKDSSRPLMGTLDINFVTRTDLATRTVVLSQAQIGQVRFAGAPSARSAELERRIREHIAGLGERDYPLDSILLSLDPESAEAQASHPQLRNEPPRILVRDKPASLVVFDGKPVLVPIANSTLSYAVNTNWSVFFDSATTTWYLLVGEHWAEAATLEGPWNATRSLPASFAALPDGDAFASVRAALPSTATAAPTYELPIILTAFEPTEIILTDGAPIFEPIPDTKLAFVANTDAVLMRDTAGGEFYYLVSGRWFSASSLAGPWTFATTRLPSDFLAIPAEGPRGFVRVSVPGTPEAEQALLEANIPQQREVDRNTTPPTVVYAGPPEFDRIEASDLYYAVNTSFDVLRLNGRYYVCHQGLWYVSTNPDGPWMLAETLPDVVYTIPPSHPLHRVTYVRVYSTTPTTITYGYTAGYNMGYVSSGVVVYGTGWYYPPYVVPGVVPVYYAHPYSYAGAVYYNPANGAWAQGGAIYGPYGGVAAGGTAYNPSTGAWAQRGVVYGPNGGASGVSAYNPSTGGYVQGGAVWDSNSGAASADWYNANAGITGSTDQTWESGTRTGSSTFSGSEQTVQTRSTASADGAAGGFSSNSGAQGVAATDGQGNSASLVKTQEGDVYAGSDGDVYRKTDEGWQSYEDGSWNSVDPSTTERGQTAQTNASNAQANASTAQANASAARSNANTSLESSGMSSSRDMSQLERDFSARTQGSARQSGSRSASGFQGRSGGSRRR
ncbi:MAG: hypothetical protein ACO377_11095 [Pseudomonadales bacterium]